MKPFIKILLQCYLTRMQLRHSVQQAFLKHYEIVPVHTSFRVKRKPIYEIIEEELRLAPSNRRRHYFLNCLKEIGVVPSEQKGRDYFRGIKKR